MSNFIIIGGILTLILLVIEILTGLRIIKISIKWHKILAFIILFLALIHGIFAFLYVNGIISF